VRSNPTTRAGFTIIEVVIASSLLMILIVASMTAFASSNEHLGQSMIIADVNQRANTIEDQLQEQLRSSGEFVLDDEKSSDTIDFDRIDFRPLEGASYSATLRSVVWRAENDSDVLAGDGRLEVWSGGAKLFELGRDVKDDFRVEFFEPSKTTASLGATPGDLDQEVRVSFTVMGVLGLNGATIDVHEERREVRIWIRNR
jgi:Tfp pilus assembly protein PilE